MTDKMTFEKWYDGYEWFHDPDEVLKEVWDDLVDKGFTEDEAASILSRVSGAIRNEYGD
jgi:hypothetical protein